MSSPPLYVFVSSTSLDLQPERKAVETAVHRIRETKFSGMEYFGSRDKTTHDASLDAVDKSHVYVGIFGNRYGSGITEAEYHRARKRELPCYIYFKKDDACDEKWSDNPTRLNALKEELRRNHTVTEFNNTDNLEARVIGDLYRWYIDDYLIPELERVSRGEASPARAQSLLASVKDRDALEKELPTHLLSTIERIRALYQLRAPVGDFVGREKEIAELKEMLRNGGSAGISGISGMGGIGKTELALYVAEQLRGDFPDAQLLIEMRGTADNPRDSTDALASCIRAFEGLETRLPDDVETLTTLYRNELNGKRVLILLDNAAEDKQARPFLPPAGCALLVTSREAIALPGMKRIRLEQLSPVEARDLLTEIAPGIEPEIADRICYLCGYLPLAIRAAGSLLAVTEDLDPDDYAKQLEDERARLELIGETGVDRSVEASFNLSYARLSADSARIFHCLAIFPGTFDAAAEEAICEDAGHKNLTDLLRRSLVLYDKETKRYRLHDLMRLFAKKRLEEEESLACVKRHAGHYLSVLRKTNELYKQGGESLRQGMAMFDLEWSNIQAGQAWSESQTDEDDAAARYCSDYPLAGVYLLDLRQHPREKINWYEAGLNAARQLKDRSNEGMILGNMGLAYAALGETRRAIDFYEQQLVITREIGDRRGEGNALFNKSQELKKLGNRVQAIADTEAALEIYEQIESPYAANAREQLDEWRGEGV